MRLTLQAAFCSRRSNCTEVVSGTEPFLHFVQNFDPPIARPKFSPSQSRETGEYFSASRVSRDQELPQFLAPRG